MGGVGFRRFLVACIAVSVFAGVTCWAGEPSGATPGTSSLSDAPLVCGGNATTGSGGSLQGFLKTDGNAHFEDFKYVRVVVPAGATLRGTPVVTVVGGGMTLNIERSSNGGGSYGWTGWQLPVGTTTLPTKNLYTNSSGSPVTVVVRGQAAGNVGRSARWTMRFSLNSGSADCPLLGDAVVAARLGATSSPVLGLAGDPVNTGTGNLVHSSADLPAPGGAFGLDLVRTFNSLDDSPYNSPAGWFASGFGDLWTTPFDQSIRPVSSSAPLTNAVEFRDVDGRRLLIPADGSGGWSEPDSLHAEVSWDAGASEWGLTYPTGERRSFSAVGDLVRWEDGTGYRVVVQRDVRGVLSVVTSSFDGVDRYALNFTDSNADRLIDKVTAPDGAQVSYHYVAKQLTKVSSPYYGSPGTIPWQETLVWSSRRLTELWEERGWGAPAVRRLLNDYDEYGRIGWQENELGDVTSFIYGDLDPVAGTRTTAVTHTAPGEGGETLNYVHDAEARLIGVQDPLSRSVVRAWDSRDLPQSSDSRRGARSATSYDLAGRLEESAVPDPEGIGTTSGSTSYTYCDADGQRISTVTGLDGLTTRYVYDPTATAENPAGSSDDCVDDVFEATKVIVGEGTSAPAVRFHEWDDGLLTRSVDPDGVESSFGWDVAKRLLLSETVAPGTAVEATTYFGYDGAGRRVVARSPLGNESWTVYDAAGRVVSQIGPVHVGGRSCAPAMGCAFGSTPPSGPTVTNVYWADGSLKSRTDQEGNTWSYETDYPSGSGRVETMTDPELEEWVSVYDGAGRLVSEVAPSDPQDPGGSSTTTSHEYGPLKRLAKTTDPTGRESHYCYDEDGKVAKSATGTLGDGIQIDCGSPQAGLAVTSTSTDLRGRVTQTVDPDGYVTLFEYDAADRRTRVIGPYRPSEVAYADAPYVAYDYSDDPLGRLAGVDSPGGDGAGATGRHVVETTYSPGGRTETETDAATGLVTRYLYDEAGRVAAVRGPALDPDLVGAPEVRHVYDAEGRSVAVTRDRVCASYPCAVEPGALVSSTSGFDAAGRPLEVVGPDGVVTAYSWTAGGLVDTVVTAPGTGDEATVSYLQYRFDGQVEQVRDANLQVTTYGYGSRGQRLVRTDAASKSESWVYDTAGRLLGREDALDRSSSNGYDDHGRLVTTSDASGRSVVTDLSAGGRVEATVHVWGRPDPVPDEQIEVGYVYDGLGRRSAMVDPAGTTTYGYDPAGRLTERVDVGGRRTLWGFDDAGRAVLVTNPDGSAYERAYDPGSGRLASITPAQRWADTFTGPDGSAVDGYKWTTNGTSVDSAVDVDGNSLRLVFGDSVAANANVRLLGSGFADGRIDLRYRFEDNSKRGNFRVFQRLDGGRHYRVQVTNETKGVRVWAKNGALSTLIGSFNEPVNTDWHRLRFEVEGDQVRTKIWADGSVEPQGWDSEVTDTEVGTVGQTSLRYYRNDDGGTHAMRVDDVKVVDLGASEPALVSYGWDVQGRVVSEVVGGVERVWSYEGARLVGYGQGAEESVLGYDDAGRVSSEVSGGLGRVFGYDSAGQLTSVTPSVGPGVSWGYDGLGRRVSETTVAGTTTFHYDDGDQVVHAAGVGAAEFDYDGAGRLVSVDPVVGDGVVYGYDAAGRLAETVRGAVVSTRGYDGDGGLRVVGGGAGSTVIDWDPVGVGVPLGFQDGGGSTNLVGVDGRWAGAQQGSGLVAFDVDVFGSVGAGGGGGGVAAAEGYDVFGNPVGVVGVDGPRLGFRGELHVAGDIYLRARTYSPGFGAFLTPDPLDGVDGTPTVANPYHYVDNDPLNKTDPTGLRPTDGDAQLVGFDCVFSCYSPPGYYDRKTFDIHGVDLSARGWNMNQCIFFGRTCSAASGKPRAEATAQAHAIRELSSHHGTDSRCTGCDAFQHVRDIFWEVGVPGGRIDILVKQKRPLVDIYEVKQWGLDPFAQLNRYTRALEGMGLSVALGTELTGWAVKYRINGADHVAWQGPAGVVWYSPVPDSEEGRQRHPELKAVYDRARRVEESDPFGGTSGSGPIPIPIRPPVLV